MWQSLVHKDGMNAYDWMKGTFPVVIQNATVYQRSSLSGIWIEFSAFEYFKLQWKKNEHFVSVFWLTPEILVNLVLNPTIPLMAKISVNSVTNWTLYIFVSIMLDCLKCRLLSQLDCGLDISLPSIASCNRKWPPQSIQRFISHSEQLFISVILYTRCTSFPGSKAGWGRNWF